MISKFKAFSISIAACLALTGNSNASNAQMHWFDAELLDGHNQERAAFGSEPLRWNPELAREAHQWARTLAKEGRMRHASNDERKGRGENLWMGTKRSFDGRTMIGAFNDERKHFRPGTFPQISRTGNWRDVGHYSQVVWPETREVGCALAEGRSQEFLVCRYWPAGNTYGRDLKPRR